eukprot:1834381-Rhodomonas_salina.2
MVLLPPPTAFQCKILPDLCLVWMARVLFVLAPQIRHEENACSEPSPNGAVGMQATLGGTLATSGDVQREQVEARVVERRRRLEDERKQRIFNAKQRTIGIDKQALERQ